MQEELAKMQKILNLSLKDGFSDIHEAESKLRSRMSQVRVTTNSANMIEARNAELARILEEEEVALGELRSAEKSRADDYEFGNLSRSVNETHDRVAAIASRLQ